MAYGNIPHFSRFQRPVKSPKVINPARVILGTDAALPFSGGALPASVRFRFLHARDPRNPRPLFTGVPHRAGRAPPQRRWHERCAILADHMFQWRPIHAPPLAGRTPDARATAIHPRGIMPRSA